MSIWFCMAGVTVWSSEAMRHHLREKRRVQFARVLRWPVTAEPTRRPQAMETFGVVLVRRKQLPHSGRDYTSDATDQLCELLVLSEASQQVLDPGVQCEFWVAER